jgi:predicted N-acetyltransferase YhbS
VSGPVIRSETPGDAEAVSDLHLAAFGEHGRTVNAMVDDLRPTVVERGGSAFVAELAGRVVGHVMVTASLRD